VSAWNLNLAASVRLQDCAGVLTQSHLQPRKLRAGASICDCCTESVMLVHMMMLSLVGGPGTQY
jgi:hypothetical protein